MGVEQHRDAALAQLLEQAAHDAPTDGVKRAGRLIEQQQPRGADQRLRDAEPLLHSLRHRLDPLGARIAELDQVEQLGPLSRAALGAAEALV